MRSSHDQQTAPGFRGYHTGALSSIGPNGYSYSSSVIDTTGVHMGFGAAWLYPISASNRTYGFQLRCLSE